MVYNEMRFSNRKALMEFFIYVINKIKTVNLFTFMYLRFFYAIIYITILKVVPNLIEFNSLPLP